MKRLFPLGRIVATPGAIEALENNQVDAAMLLALHVSGDWGDVNDDPHDKKVNNDAVKYGGRILSAYTLPHGEKIWVITEADRSATTFLLPDED